MTPLIAALSALMMALSILDAASTQWKRARRGDRIELNPVMRWIMGWAGDYWVVVRALGGLALWAWIVLARGWPLAPASDTLVAVMLGLVSAALALVVYKQPVAVRPVVAALLRPAG